MNATPNQPTRDPRAHAPSKFARSVSIGQRLLRRPLRQQWLVIEAFVTLWWVKAMLLGLPFERWRRFLQRPLRRSATAPVECVNEIVWAVDRVSRRWSTLLTCLPQAIAVHSIMARRHWNSKLEIGVAKDADGRFDAHAWVEHGGQIIIGQVPNMERFARLPVWAPNVDVPSRLQ
jgi:hypothetical protein